MAEVPKEKSVADANLEKGIIVEKQSEEATQGRREVTQAEGEVAVMTSTEPNLESAKSIAVGVVGGDLVA